MLVYHVTVRIKRSDDRNSWQPLLKWTWRDDVMQIWNTHFRTSGENTQILIEMQPFNQNVFDRKMHCYHDELPSEFWNVMRYNWYVLVLIDFSCVIFVAFTLHYVVLTPFLGVSCFDQWVFLWKIDQTASCLLGVF